LRWQVSLQSATTSTLQARARAENSSFLDFVTLQICAAHASAAAVRLIMRLHWFSLPAVFVFAALAQAQALVSLACFVLRNISSHVCSALLLPAHGAPVDISLV
jgi:hypothetical protein